MKVREAIRLIEEVAGFLLQCGAVTGNSYIQASLDALQLLESFRTTLRRAPGTAS
jgi:hypothetical protein